MFQSLRTRLTVLYAALFGLAMLLVALAVYGAITAAARRQVENELVAGGAVFDRLWTLQSDQLSDAASVLARDYGFREAAATSDQATIASALENLKGRLGLDVAFLVGMDGKVTGLAGADADMSRQLWEDLDGGAVSGVLQLKDQPYQAVSAPVLAPQALGWVVFAQRLDRAEMASLEELSSIPLKAAVAVKDHKGWTAPGLSRDDGEQLAAFTAAAMRAKTARPRNLSTREGATIALAKPLKAFGGENASALVLRYPLSLALGPYRLMLASVFIVGLAGMGMVIGGSFLLARSITKPVSALDDAARRLQAGERVTLQASTKDELGRLALSFNAMADGIADRERRITRMALTDQETGLPNRRAFEAAMAASEGRSVAVIGIDRYQELRNALGYRLAADVTREIGARLSAVWPEAGIARLSNERLGFVLDTLRSEAATELVLAALEEPLVLDGATVDVELTAGLAPIHSDEPIPAIERASIALDQARASGRKVAPFDAEAYGDPGSKLSLMSEMLTALHDGSMALHYQPKYSLMERRMTGAEALVRWRHPVRGTVPPDLFVELAEETGHIRELTRFTLQRIIADQMLLRAAGHDLRLSLNLSGRLVGDRAFVDEMVAQVREAGAKLCFEITETAVIGNKDAALVNIDVMRASGIAISIDDYGSGLSSLAYLKQLPADELKIDKAFILSLAESTRDALLVKSTIDLAHSLGLKVVAEGVETEKAMALLSTMGCDLAQGWHIAKALPLDKLVEFLAVSSQSERAPMARSA